ncbi:MAG: hypothetical protein HKN04_06285, partial [Rhodothermaceae bacterium]|nr:hypothetical protein [Rhodothermaceae bacterium]
APAFPSAEPTLYAEAEAMDDALPGAPTEEPPAFPSWPPAPEASPDARHDLHLEANFPEPEAPEPMAPPPVPPTFPDAVAPDAAPPASEEAIWTQTNEWAESASVPVESAEPVASEPAPAEADAPPAPPVARPFGFVELPSVPLEDPSEEDEAANPFAVDSDPVASLRWASVEEDAPISAFEPSADATPAEMDHAEEPELINATPIPAQPGSIFTPMDLSEPASEAADERNAEPPADEHEMSPVEGPLLDAAAISTGEPTFSTPAFEAPAPPVPAREEPAPEPAAFDFAALESVESDELASAPQATEPPPAPAYAEGDGVASEPEPAPAAPAAHEADRPPVVPESAPIQGDDLTVISGIDEAVQQQLYALGVTKLDEMARWSRADARHISSAVGVSEQTIMHQWIFEAQSALFELYQQQLSQQNSQVTA